MRTGLSLLLAGLLCAAPAAHACTIVKVEGPRGRALDRAAERHAWRGASLVVRGDVLSAKFEPKARDNGVTYGEATARVTHVEKGVAWPGEVVAYRLRRGEDAVTCPIEEYTSPGWAFRLYLAPAPNDHLPQLVRYRVLGKPRGSDPR